MTDRQVRDEAMTIFLAGHETTANALTWTWYLLEPVAGRRSAAARGDRSRAGGTPADGRRRRSRCRTPRASSPNRCGCIRRRGSSAAARSTSTPSAAITCRRASIVVMSQWIVHRDPRHYPRSRAIRSRIAGRRSSRPRCRASRTFRSAADRASASANRSRGWSWCWWSRRSRSAGASTSCPVIPWCRRPP